MRKVNLTLSTTTTGQDSRFIKARLENAVLPELRDVLKKYGFTPAKGFGISIKPEQQAKKEVAE